MSIQMKYAALEQAYPNLLQGIGMLIQKGKLSKRFKSIQIDEDEIQELTKAKELCELRIVELWEERNNEGFVIEFKALCSTYFDIASQLPVPLQSEYFVYETIKLIAFGYLGEHWHFVKQYLNEISSDIQNLDSGQN